MPSQCHQPSPSLLPQRGEPCRRTKPADSLTLRRTHRVVSPASSRLGWMGHATCCGLPTRQGKLKGRGHRLAVVDARTLPASKVSGSGCVCAVEGKAVAKRVSIGTRLDTGPPVSPSPPPRPLPVLAPLLPTRLLDGGLYVGGCVGTVRVSTAGRVLRHCCAFPCRLGAASLCCIAEPRAGTSRHITIHAFRRVYQQARGVAVAVMPCCIPSCIAVQPYTCRLNHPWRRPPGHTLQNGRRGGTTYCLA